MFKMLVPCTSWLLKLMDGNMDKNKLGEALLKAKKISKDSLKRAFAMHDKIGGDFAPLLVKLGYVSDDDLTEIMGNIQGISTIDVTSLVIPQKLMYTIPRDVIEKHNVIPISKKENQITLAMSNVDDFDAIEEIQFLTGCRVEPALSSRDAIRKAIIQFYSEEEEKEEEFEKREKPIDDIMELVKSGDIDQLQLIKILLLLLVEKKVISHHELVDRLQRLVR